jgi:5,10-methylene-tetrahydrofolate dehydrogenase/methenyl tetrahydrofolate cyclohydrolase
MEAPKEVNPKLISGTHWSKVIRDELKEEIAKLVSEGRTQPKLAGIIVGDREDSKIYVRNKERACADIGMASTIHRLPGTTSNEELIELIQKLNADESVHGILVQLPLPSTMNEQRILESISPAKDVDGVAGPTQLGKLAYKGYEADFIPCTAKASIELLKREKIPIAGQNVVVLGRSAIVGMPALLLLLKENATVTVCHSRTKNIDEVVRRADIVIAAIGVAQFVKKEWLKEGVVIIDVGINQIEDKTKKAGHRLVGDVDFENCLEVCSKITPVPGGVGPMTITMLLSNVLESSKKPFNK